ncbi:MAG: TonB-dependent receptor [Saprospiraceae bacterium]|nr:TonB-dependent receptor [Saprospiraceae bacterium]
MRHALFWILAEIFNGWCSLHAQSDSTTLLSEVLIRRQRADRNGYTIWKADSLPVGGVLSLSDRLFWDNAAGVRPYAPGALSSLSIRGAGPKRSPVLWNGLSLQSPMNGTVDLSLIPVWAGDRLEVRYGGQSAAQSSGSMGGSVVLESQPVQMEPGFFGTISATAGSWQRFENMISTGYATEQVVSEIRASWQRSTNDFPYRNFTELGKPMVRQSNNFGEKWDIQQHNQLKINTKNTLKSAVWYQRVFREIPPTMTQLPTETWQRDRATRAVVTWENRPRSRSLLQTRAAWLDESIFFYLYGKTDSSRARTLLLSSDFSTTAGTYLFFKSGLSLQRQWANADGYADSTIWYGQSRLAAYATGERRFKNGSISLLLRQEWVQDQAAPFTWSLGGAFRLAKGQVRFHVSRNFNLPTFNDRFWNLYGRTDLSSERGYSSDLGWKYTHLSFFGEVSVFQILMDDWIDWQPGPDGIFRPFNLKKVWSRGVSLSGGRHWQKGRWRWQLKGRYEYLKATNVSVYSGGQGTVNKQLAYTPSHSAGIDLQVRRGSFSGAYLHQYTGPRFSTTDNSTTLPGFQTGNLLLQYGFAPVSKKLSGCSLGFRVENIWNTPYQVLQYRPMPGRGWRVEVMYDF